MKDFLATGRQYYEELSSGAYWEHERADNHARFSSDLASGTRQLFELEKDIQGENGMFSEWMRAAYEINEDFDQPFAIVVDRICTAIRESDHLYGRTPTLQLYNTQAVILPGEIKSAAHYLSLGGCFEFLPDLAKNGFFSEEYSHEEMIRAVQFLNAGGAANEVYEKTQEVSIDQQVIGGIPTL